MSRRVPRPASLIAETVSLSHCDGSDPGARITTPPRAVDLGMLGSHPTMSPDIDNLGHTAP
jgi:hypothetical protein